jgi:hypothetical protein
VNIFVLDYDPIKAAQFQCDTHVVKMSLESAQILCSAFESGVAPYKKTHFNHPCSIWARRSKENYKWLIKHAIGLCEEYTFRYGKIHKSKEVILWCQRNMHKLKFEEKKKTRFILCFENEFKIGNAVESYRQYYRVSKRQIAKWNKTRSTPSWFNLSK